MLFDESPPIEQLAGDLLPNATTEQKIATGFHRNTMLNEEGGIDPLEYRFNAMVDRVATTGATWLGLTMQCAQCHTHKYDPITHRDYYQLMALLDNADEPELDLPPSDAAVREKQRRRAPVAAHRRNCRINLPSRPAARPGRRSKLRADRNRERRTGPAPRGFLRALRCAGAGKGNHHSSSVQTTDREVHQLRLEALADPSLPKKGPGRAGNGNFVLSEITVTAAPANAPDRAELP